MRRRLEAALPLLVLVGFAAAAILVNLLLTNAQDQGVDALEEAIEREVEAIAGNQNQQLIVQLIGIGDAAQDAVDRLELTVDSEADKELLAPFGEDAEAGLYLLNLDGTITQGVLLPEDRVGAPFEWPGFDSVEALVTADDVADGVVLPVQPEGLTTEQPAFAFVVPITTRSEELVGAVVIEEVVSDDSNLSAEMEALQSGHSGEYLLFDRNGEVIASNEPASVLTSVVDDGFVEVPAGVHRFDGDVVSIADIPLAGWRVAFRQDAEEFERALARPVESVGQILVFVLLAAGFVLTLLLNRRLRAARAEQERLRDLNSAQQELISIVSHELRTPVAGVLGFLETTLDHWDAMEEEDRRRAVTRAATNARRLQAMTRDVLDTQTVESGRLVHVMEPLDLSAEVRTAVEAARDLDPDRSFEVHAPDDAVWVSADGDRLQQVLANLLDNARKSSPAVEPIEVRVELVDGQAQVSVVDRGAGIEPESLERIFDKFVRGRVDGVTGTGLGLYISRQIIDAHGGRIWAESEGGAGATFRFSLPVQAAAPSAAALAD